MTNFIELVGEKFESSFLYQRMIHPLLRLIVPAKAEPSQGMSLHAVSELIKGQRVDEVVKIDDTTIYVLGVPEESEK